ncbi:hypothetical protein BD769DRAFT_1392698 [Suillus cothurnatus]|nr:hypothetical protein BD769DRAFT_1392698 [Suillus cothurnatus]
MYKPSSSGNQFWSAEEALQCYNKGNIAIRPQNSTELYTLLPPSPEELQEAIGVAYSQVNMDVLFDEVDASSDMSLLSALLIYEGFSSCDTHEDDGSQVAVANIVMEPIGYTTGDHSMQSREKMKLHALAYVLDYPWDIGGIFDKTRVAEILQLKTINDSGEEGCTNSATFTSINKFDKRECVEIEDWSMMSSFE